VLGSAVLMDPSSYDLETSLSSSDFRQVPTSVGRSLFGVYQPRQRAVPLEEALLWNCSQKECFSGQQQLIPVVLATWEAEIRRIKVQGPPRQIVITSHLQNNQSKMD
jgi:hypothetical protein